MKNNTLLRLLHYSESDEAIRSAIDKEVLDSVGANPNKFTDGEVVAKLNKKVLYFRTLYVPDDFIKGIKIM